MVIVFRDYGMNKGDVYSRSTRENWRVQENLMILVGERRWYDWEWDGSFAW